MKQTLHNQVEQLRPGVEPPPVPTQVARSTSSPIADFYTSNLQSLSSSPTRSRRVRPRTDAQDKIQVTLDYDELVTRVEQLSLRLF